MNKTPIKPGIYPDFSESEYRRLDAIGRSDLMEWAGLCKPIDPDVAATGTVFHTAMLEPHRLAESIITPDRKLNLRRKEDKAEHESLKAKAKEQGKVLIRQAGLVALREMLRTVRADKTLGALHKAAIEGKSRQEMTVVWDFEGVLLKARIDQITPKAMIDWKSTGCESPEVFALSCEKYHYHIQNAFYQDGWFKMTGEALPFLFAVSSKRPPYRCWMHQIPQRDIDHGRTLYQTLVRLYARQKKEIAA